MEVSRSQELRVGEGVICLADSCRDRHSSRARSCKSNGFASKTIKLAWPAVERSRAIEHSAREIIMHGRPRNFKDKLKDPKASESYKKKVGLLCRMIC